jgi:hypothetical protein
VLEQQAYVLFYSKVVTPLVEVNGSAQQKTSIPSNVVVPFGSEATNLSKPVITVQNSKQNAVKSQSSELDHDIGEVVPISLYTPPPKQNHPTKKITEPLSVKPIPVELPLNSKSVIKFHYEGHLRIPRISSAGRVFRYENNTFLCCNSYSFLK